MAGVPDSQEPLRRVMDTVVKGFQQTTDAMQQLQERQDKLEQEQRALEQQQKEHLKAAYNGMTGSGKARYVSELVEIEKKKGERGSQARVARTLDLTAGRIAQLINSEKNRKNGK